VNFSSTGGPECFFCGLTTHYIFTDPQWEAVGTAVINASGPVIEDINSHLPLPHFGRGLSSSTSDTTGHRSSIRDRLDVVAANSTDKLTIMTNTLATKVLLCRSGGDVVAYGLSVAPGAKLPIAQGSSGKQDLNETRIVAKREVIISAGVFQSPQLVSSSCPRNNVHFAYPSAAHGIL
jgi:choline dehydrogenase-like flavoprotein